MSMIHLKDIYGAWWSESLRIIRPVYIHTTSFTTVNESSPRMRPINAGPKAAVPHPAQAQVHPTHMQTHSSRQAPPLGILRHPKWPFHGCRARRAPVRRLRIPRAIARAGSHGLLDMNEGTARLCPGLGLERRRPKLCASLLSRQRCTACQGPEVDRREVSLKDGYLADWVWTT